MRPNPETILFPPIQWTRWQANVFTQGHFDAHNTFGVDAFRRTWSGGVTPGFKTLNRRVRKKLPTLDHTVTISRCSGTVYTERCDVYNGTGTYLYTDTYRVDNFALLMSHPAVAHLGEAQQKARARLGDGVGGLKANLAQAFAERKQTASLLESTATRILMAARALRRGHLGDFCTALSLPGANREVRIWERVIRTPKDKRIATHWLEFQYGWKPLLQDCFDSAELIAEHSQERYVTQAKGSGKSTSVVFVAANGFTPEVIQRTTTRVKMCVNFQLDSQSRFGLAATGISNPALLAWELLPYSFVVDWLYPVGNYLKALDDFSGFIFVDGWQSQTSILVRQETKLTGGYKTVSGGNSLYWTVNGSGTHESIKYDRTKLTSFPGVGLPSFKNPIGGEPAQRVFTAISLLRVLFQ